MQMTHEDVIRSWKDEDFRLSLTPEQQAMLPSNPAGVAGLANEELTGSRYALFTAGQSICCISETGGCTVFFCHRN